MVPNDDGASVFHRMKASSNIAALLLDGKLLLSFAIWHD
jgi:hypothetical protein